MITILDYAERIIHCGGKLFLYGCGEIGTLMEEFLSHYGIKISGYLVSDGHMKIDTINGINIFEISKTACSEKDGIILAVSSLYYNEIIPEIVNKNYKNLYFLRLEEIYVAKAMKKLSELGVDLRTDILDFGEFKFPNLFEFASKEMTVSELYETISEFQDLVYPFLDDYSQVAEGLYEHKKVRLDKNDIVLDCGANIGLFSARAAALGCKVFSFEPSPIPSQYLKMVKEIYHNITIVPYALAEKEGVSTFFDVESNIGAGNIIGSTHDGLGKRFKVKVTTVDEFVKKNRLEKLDFIKADIEGAERMMLKGARETLRRYSPKLSVCFYHLYDDIPVLTDLILDANPNYKITYAWQKLYAWVE
ncbi:MAG: FkbM family methyltransferase [Lachnospiraceae bacterium]|nr:FkbM family methyltransferase [Lachnospiraceae bacterium]